MRTLVLMRGGMGAGKSTWIEKMGLKPYTLSPDEIRLLFASPQLTETGGTTISMNHDKKVWQLLFDLLEQRMQRGEFTVIDATHQKTKDMNQYKELAQKYRYRVYVVDFTSVPIEVALEQNLKRPEHKRVPVQAIHNAYERFKTQGVPGWIEVVDPMVFPMKVRYDYQVYDEWKKIHVFGDIHGCYDVLMDYFDNNGGIKDDELYIFVGDYVDRGIQNAEVMEWIFSVVQKKNFIFLEGNHERWLWDWANNVPVKSKEFENVTKKQLEQAGISKKQTRIFYRLLRQAVYFKYHDKFYLVTHGGLAYLPKDLILVPTEQMIKGVGNYKTDIDDLFNRNMMPYNIFQIHGHRNLMGHPIRASRNSFNLEGGVERGGDLRVLTIDESELVGYCLENDVISERFKQREPKPVVVDNAGLLSEMRNNPLVKEKELPNNISSFNFSNKVFYDRLWDAQNVKARGLFINTQTTEIVARSYDKTFHVNEVESTTLYALKENLVFPVDAYIKENGFLGILGYDSASDQLVIASKSTTEGLFAEMFKTLLYATVGERIGEMKEYLREENLTAVFEVIDPVNDPHIIEYFEPHIVLLDLVKRTPEYSKLDYEKVVDIANRFGLRYKRRIARFNDWQSFLGWYNSVTSETNSTKLEGFMVEDSKGFMFKVKIQFYNFWKQMRGLKDKVARGKQIATGSLTTPLHNEVYAFFLSYDKELLAEKNIIELRNEFLQMRQKGGYQQ